MLELLDDQVAGIDSRLGRLYDALETGSFQHGDLAPRIRELTRKKEEGRTEPVKNSDGRDPASRNHQSC
jgi:hypothetical protein